MANRMRVAYLVSQYPAPSHTFIRREVEALREAGIEVDTFSVRRPSQAERAPDRDREAYEATWYILPVGAASVLGAHARSLLTRPVAYLRTLAKATRYRALGVRGFVWSLFHFTEGLVLATEMKRRGITHVHSHFANSGANIGFLASWFLGVDWSFTVHGTSDLDSPSALLLPMKIRFAKWVAFASHFGRAQGMRIVDPSLWSKMFVARCGVDLTELPQQSTRSSHRPPRVLAVGRLSPEKGFHGLVEGFARLVREGIVAELRLVGDGPAGEELRALVESEGLASQVTMSGRLSEAEVLQELRDCDVLVVSSLMEGLPVVLMEALAMGVPVVAPRVAGIPELVEDEQSGLLFTAGRWEELATCMRRMLGDPALRARLAEAGRARVEAEFDIRVAVQPLLARYTGKLTDTVRGPT